MSDQSGAACGIGIIGVAGYGQVHLASIAACADRGLCTLRAATVRPQDSDPEREAELKGQGVKIYRSVEAMLSGETDRVQLVAIPTGIPSHAELSIAALEAGYHVLCEKPAAGNLAEALRMRRCAGSTGRILAIGYQHVYSKGTQTLKRLCAAGLLGNLLEARVLARWPRDSSYYGRNDWAGRLEYDGRPINDSPAQNATSHYLNDMLYVAGPGPDKSALPLEVYGENYRAKPIESADTQFVRMRTDTGVAIQFIATHATKENYGPDGFYRFENGTVTFTSRGDYLDYTLDTLCKIPPELDPSELEPDPEVRARVFVSTIEAIREGGRPLCTIDNAVQHCVCIDAAFESSNGVKIVPGEFTETLPGTGTNRVPMGDEVPSNVVIRGIEELTDRMHLDGSSFVEAGAPWGESSRIISVDPSVLK